ncbi:hypothetical protein IW256_004744 [Actinomadura viridis]|uniref:Uncharacterized protein n=1 Tax=Actinomadura viridis TaxID=58110 RepID=A0A931DN24_9ACTN|nr:hypothetical protein [Actinomadura viridis]
MHGAVPGIGISTLIYGTVWLVTLTARAFRSRR